ncbi:MAG TPA: hypothetical protein VGA40_05985 [Candidatus Acidoferrales bacterium]
MRIESQAPTRVDLAGGTLDIWPLYLQHAGAVTVNAAITRYARVVLTPQRGRRITLVSRDTRRSESFASLASLENAGLKPGATRAFKLPLLAHLVRFFRPRGGFSLTTDSEAPAGAGIGGSSAMAVAICAAFDRWLHLGLSRVEWIHLARDAEATVIVVPTGTQDHYPPAFGGACVIHLAPGAERLERLRVNLNELDRRILVCYTGKPRQSGINNWEVFKAHIEGDRRVWRNIERISQVAQAMRTALERERWVEAARLMREEWSFRRRNLPTISTPVIDRIMSAALRNGAMAGKVCGAGGGGCMVFLIEPDARGRVEAAVAAAGGEVLPSKIDRRGVLTRVVK